MADEPSNGELGRRLDVIQHLLQDLVGRAEYNARQEAADRRFAELAADIEDTRRQHSEDIRAVHQRLADADRKSQEHRLSWRTAFWSGILPALVVLAGILVQIWLAHSGGVHK